MHQLDIILMKKNTSKKLINLIFIYTLLYIIYPIIYYHFIIDNYKIVWASDYINYYDYIQLLLIYLFINVFIFVPSYIWISKKEINLNQDIIDISYLILNLIIIASFGLKFRDGIDAVPGASMWAWAYSTISSIYFSMLIFKNNVSKLSGFLYILIAANAGFKGVYVYGLLILLISLKSTLFNFIIISLAVLLLAIYFEEKFIEIIDRTFNPSLSALEWIINTRFLENYYFEMSAIQAYKDKIFGSFNNGNFNVALQITQSWDKNNITSTIYSIPLQYNFELLSLIAILKIIFLCVLLFWPYFFIKNLCIYKKNIFIVVYIPLLMHMTQSGFIEILRFIFIQLFVIFYINKLQINQNQIR